MRVLVVVHVVVVVEVVGEELAVCVGVDVCVHACADDMYVRCVDGVCMRCVVCCSCARGAEFRQAGVSSVPWRISWADSQDEIKEIETSDENAAKRFFPEKS